MAKTLLNAVNEVLSRVSILDADTGVLASLSDSARQTFIDLAIQVVNEGVDDLYAATSTPRPNNLTEDASTITLVTGDRDYALPADLIAIKWPLHDETNGQFIGEFPGGYFRLINSEPTPPNRTGLPTGGAIRPSDGQLYLDAQPTANENGRVYELRYVTDVSLSVAADTVPFTDAVFRAMVPAWAELFKFQNNQEFSDGLFKRSMGRAGRMLIQTESRTSWSPRRQEVHSATDPMSQ